MVPFVSETVEMNKIPIIQLFFTSKVKNGGGVQERANHTTGGAKHGKTPVVKEEERRRVCVCVCVRRSLAETRRGAEERKDASPEFDEVSKHRCLSHTHTQLLHESCHRYSLKPFQQ